MSTGIVEKDQHDRALKLAVQIATALAGSSNSTAPGLIVEALTKSYAEIRRLDSESGQKQVAGSGPR